MLWHWENDEIELYAGISIIYNMKMERSLVGRYSGKGRTAFHCSVSRVATLLCLCMWHLRPICVLNFTIVLSLSKTTNHIRIPSKRPFSNSDLTSLPIMYYYICNNYIYNTQNILACVLRNHLWKENSLHVW